MKTATKERGLLFSGPMVKAILDGRKTMTRRTVKPQPQVTTGSDASWRDAKADLWRNARQYARDCCPYGRPGERLYVRETWKTEEQEDGCTDGIRFKADDEFVPIPNKAWAADSWVYAHSNGIHGKKWRPGIHLPKWASRLTLEITGVRVERVQSCSAKDIVAEGVVDRPHKVEGLSGMCPVSAVDGACYPDLRSLWAAAWIKINGKESWAANPYVWVVSFRRVEAAP